MSKKFRKLLSFKCCHKSEVDSEENIYENIDDYCDLHREAQNVQEEITGELQSHGPIDTSQRSNIQSFSLFLSSFKNNIYCQ